MNRKKFSRIWAKSQINSVKHIKIGHLSCPFPFFWAFLRQYIFFFRLFFSLQVLNCPSFCRLISLHDYFFCVIFFLIHMIFTRFLNIYFDVINTSSFHRSLNMIIHFASWFSVTTYGLHPTHSTSNWTYIRILEYCSRANW